MKFGKLIVIEGLDGSGKNTQTELLMNFFLKNKKNVKKISFPNYSSNSSALVKMYLNSEFGHKPTDVNAYAATSFYSVDRYSSFKKDWEKFYKIKESKTYKVDFLTSNHLPLYDYSKKEFLMENWDNFDKIIDVLDKYIQELEEEKIKLSMENNNLDVEE